MAIARKKRARPKREALVFKHLEHVSRRLLEAHFDVVQKFIGGNAGVYALYDGDKLYYVGLAGKLAPRLKAHLKDRHKGGWDSFSIYLTIKIGHMKEIESLLLRILKPDGNAVRGKTAASRDLIRLVRQELKAKLDKETDFLVGRIKATAGEEVSTNEEEGALTYLFPKGAQLQGTNKRRLFKARLLRNGQVRFDGQTFNSVSQAAATALGRPTNGWWFWKAQRGRGNWVRLLDIKRAGTPI